MKNVITVTNLTLIFAAAYAIWFLSAYLYLGTEEMHEQLKAELPRSFMVRTEMPLALAVLFSVLLGLVNWVVAYFTKSPDKLYPLKIAVLAFIVCMSSGLVGVAAFFWW